MMRKKSLLLLVVVLPMTIAILLTGCGGKSVDISDAIHISFEGIDGSGEAYAYVDGSAVEDKLANLYGNSGNIDWTTLYALTSSLHVELDKTSNLSLGDKITATIKYNEEEAKKLKVKLEGTTKEIQVTGLIDTSTLAKIDPFEKLEVTFSGESGDAYININNNNTIKGFYFEADKNDDLSNGDEVKITCEFDETSLIYEGYAVTQKEKTYTVEGLSEYVTAINQISDDLIKRMDAESQDQLKSYVAKEWKSSTLKSMDLVNEYLLVRKPGYYGDNNMFYLVYKVVGNEVEHGDFTFYWYGGFTNILRTGDICTTDLTYILQPSGSASWGDLRGDAFWLPWEDGESWWCVGFETEDKLKYKVIDANVSEYTYELLKEVSQNGQATEDTTTQTEEAEGTDKKEDESGADGDN